MEDAIIKWVNILASIVALVVGITSWIKSKKLMPEEIEKVKLENASKEVSIAEQFNNLAISAAKQVNELHERVTKIEKEYREIQSENANMKDKHDALSKSHIELQSKHNTLKSEHNALKEEYESLNEKLITVESDLTVAQEYINTLIEQLKESNIPPKPQVRIKTTSKQK